VHEKRLLRSEVISVGQLVKRYGSVTAVDGVTFEIARGEVVGFLGPNGAGKTTTLRILAGFLGATSGTVTIAGHDVTREPRAAQRALGYMPEAVPLYPEMRVGEYLTFRAELKGVPRGKRKDAVARAMARARVDDVATRLVGNLSKGYRQRVGLADALVAEPPILILDEPTAGLDPNQIREVRALVRELAQEHTVLLSTHILGEVEASCTRVLVVAKGKLVAEGSVDHVRTLARHTGAVLVVRGDGARAAAIAQEIEGFASVDAEGHAVRCTFDAALSEDARDLAIETAVLRVSAAGLGVREVRREGGTLEEVFAQLTASPAPEAA